MRPENGEDWSERFGDACIGIVAILVVGVLLVFDQAKEVIHDGLAYEPERLA